MTSGKKGRAKKKERDPIYQIEFPPSSSSSSSSASHIKSWSTSLLQPFILRCCCWAWKSHDPFAGAPRNPQQHKQKKEEGGGGKHNTAECIAVSSCFYGIRAQVVKGATVAIDVFLLSSSSSLFAAPPVFEREKEKFPRRSQQEMCVDRRRPQSRVVYMPEVRPAAVKTACHILLSFLSSFFFFFSRLPAVPLAWARF